MERRFGVVMTPFSFSNIDIFIYIPKYYRSFKNQSKLRLNLSLFIQDYTKNSLVEVVAGFLIKASFFSVNIINLLPNCRSSSFRLAQPIQPLVWTAKSFVCKQYEVLQVQ